MKSKSLKTRDKKQPGLPRLLEGMQENVSLAEYTTFKIGGPAKYFFIAKTKEEIIKAILWAKEQGLPFFILGGGSNLLVADEGFNGLVIKMENKKSKIQSEDSKFKIISEAGLPLAKLVSEAQEIGAVGLEWAAGIPGTVGGAVRGNAGAFGHFLAEVVKTVEVLEIPERETKNQKPKTKNSTLKLKTFNNRDCEFGYRESVFKSRPHFIILSASFELKKGKKSEIQKKIKEYLAYRQKMQPLNFPSAGSIFKNPKSKIKNQKLLDEFPLLVKFNQREEIPAAFLIEMAGLKGKKIGQAQISEKHANFIINRGGAKAEDVLELISLAKKKVKEKFGLVLEEEIQVLGV